MKKIILFILLLCSTTCFAETSGQILGAADAAYYITTPWDGNEIWLVQYAQVDNSMYLVDGNNPPQVLTRTDHNAWTIADVTFETGPFLPENATTETITPSGTTGSITIEYSGAASEGLFQSTTDASHVGSIWAINQVRKSSTVSGSFTADGTSVSSGFVKGRSRLESASISGAAGFDSDPTEYFSGSYSFTTTGTWVGTVTLQRSTNGGMSWRTALGPFTDTNFDNPSETEEHGAIYRVVMSNYTSGTCNYKFTIADNVNKGVVEITDVTDGNTATATVVTDLVDTNGTTEWREGYWSDYRGWPKTVAFHQQRLVFGGSTSYPQTLWFGKADPDDYTNFLEGIYDTSAFVVALQGQNPIRWLKSQENLVIGTSGSVGVYGEQGKAITPTSPNYREQSKLGSDLIMAIDASDSILFVERGGRKIREFSYSFAYDKHLTPDLTMLAEDITDSGIVDVAFQASPDATLWCVLDDGNMATLTYRRDQEVIGWTLQTTDGDFESVCRIPGLTYEDEIWVVVNRTIDGSEVRYIEKFAPRDWGSDVNDAWFVDSGLSYDGTATTSFSGIDHLEGEDLYIYADRLIESNEVVASGAITIDNAAARVLVGLPYTSKLETLPLVIDPQDKIANKKMQRVGFDLYETGYLEYGNGANATLETINFENSLIADPNATAQALYTSIVAPKVCYWPWGSMRKQTVYLESSAPMPLTVRAITTEWVLYP
jgi:hypothetical protein